MVAPLTVQAYFGESTLPVGGVRSIRIMEAEYEHERAIITVNGSNPTSKRFVSGAPVAIHWGFPPGASAWFVGYVNHTEPVHEPLGGDRDKSSGPGLRVVCVGVSWPSKDQRVRTFRHLAPATAVKKIASEMRLDTSRIAAPGVISPVLHQGGKSDWEFMVDCAKKAGLTLFTRGTALYCEDRRVLVAQSAAVAPVLTAASAGGTVSEFTPLRGAAALGGGETAIRTATMLNLRSGNITRHREATPDRPVFTGRPIMPLQTKAQVRTPFSSLGDAREHLAAEARVNSLGQSAHLVAGVNPRCRVGKAVAVQGFGPDADGIWYITAAEQVVDGPSNGQMSLTLGRDTETPYVGARPTGLSSVAAQRRARLLGGTQWVAA